jgi:hypothetical protein
MAVVLLPHTVRGCRGKEKAASHPAIPGRILQDARIGTVLHVRAQFQFPDQCPAGGHVPDHLLREDVAVAVDDHEVLRDS